VDVGKRRGPKPRLIRTCKLFEEMLVRLFLLLPYGQSY
jgi:hypothetical protein